jgi:hypothetical protein
MKNIFIISVLLLSLSGCQSAEEEAQAQAAHDAQITKQARADLMAELKAKEEATNAADGLKNAKLSQVGIVVHDKEITINPEKAKDFFDNIGKKIEEKLRDLTKNLDKGMVEGEDTGIHMTSDKINIDLNKTQDFLNTWGKKMQSFVKEIDSMAKSMDTTTQNVK